MSRVVCVVDVFMIVSPRLVDELILSRREQALKGCSGHCFIRDELLATCLMRQFILPCALTFYCENGG